MAAQKISPNRRGTVVLTGNPSGMGGGGGGGGDTDLEIDKTSMRQGFGILHENEMKQQETFVANPGLSQMKSI